MSIEKKSLISNRTAAKKANLTKASATKVSSTKLAKPTVKLMVKPAVNASSTLVRTMVR